ncbi:MAG: DNA polymerase IV [Alphaproteobacteria bacterium]|nr:DNA polymerase IV [Alphaproteobacteria bacterium]
MEAGEVAAVCRNCGRPVAAPVPTRCPSCHSPRLAAHPEIARVGIAHLDCDAFYAAIEKRDDPSLADRPVVIGGGRRGVVAAACYVARRFGVRSAMAMYQALDACPHAVVLRPDMAKYRKVGREVRSLMREATPLVEPISIDEAFLDLGEHALPAAAAARLVRRIEDEVGITVSVGLAANKFLAKIASDLDKPRGFAVIGPGEAPAFLAGKPVTIVPGVGAAMARRLRAEGVLTIADLRRWTEAELTARFGVFGRRLYSFARGLDRRRVQPTSETRSISAETTFESDRSDFDDLARALPPLARTVAARLGAAGLAAGAVVLKLKTENFRTQTRSHALASATQRADRLLEEAEQLLRPEADGRAFRLIGLGAGDLVPAEAADPPELFAGAC